MALIPLGAPLERETAPLGSPSLRDIGVSKLRALAGALDASPAELARATHVFDLLTKPWSTWRAGHRPPWPNDITDDGSPFEFSLAFTGNAIEWRLLVESQERPLSSTSSFAAGLALNARLSAEGADTRLFETVRHDFVPGLEPVRFSLWHAAVLRADGVASFKAYLNPQVDGTAAAEAKLEHAMLRAGLGKAWSGFRAELRALGHMPQFKYFSADLAEPSVARTKVYFSLEDARLPDLARCTQRLVHFDASEAVALLTGGSSALPSSEWPRPILVCAAFTAGSDRPELTLHVPIRWFVPHDEEAVRRVSRLLADDDARRLRRAAHAVAGRPLETGRGLLTYASLRPGARGLRVTVYLSPEVYSITSPRRQE